MIIEIRTESRKDAVDITDLINEQIKKFGKGASKCFLFLLHTTASLLIKEGLDKNISKDILNHMESVVPEKNYLHNKIDNNASAHIKSCFFNTHLLIPVKNSRLFLGEYQRVFLMEFDGPRTRKIFFELL
jgi:secondary thiamine-phosphate synthase enzyme